MNRFCIHKKVAFAFERIQKVFACNYIKYGAEWFFTFLHFIPQQKWTSLFGCLLVCNSMFNAASWCDWFPVGGMSVILSWGISSEEICKQISIIIAWWMFFLFFFFFQLSHECTCSNTNVCERLSSSENLTRGIKMIMFESWIKPLSYISFNSSQ